MSRPLIQSLMAEPQLPARSVVIAAAPCHITRAIATALQNDGASAEVYLNPEDPQLPADETVEAAAVESQQLDHVESQAMSAQLAAQLEELMDNGVYTGGRHVYVLTGGMYTGDDPTQHAMLKSIIEKSVSNTTEVEAVILDEDEEGQLMQEASNAALESYLGSMGVKVTRSTQMWSTRTGG